MSEYQRKYAGAAEPGVYLPMIKASSTDFAVAADWTPATGDVKVTKDGGTAADIATLPVYVTNCGWKFVFSATELTCKILTINIVDSAVKAVEDQNFSVITYGHASAGIVFDLSAAAVTPDAAAIRAALGLASANLDTQLGDIPTVAEFTARTLATADYFDPAVDTVANVTTVATVTNPVTAGTVSDKTGYALSSAGIQAIWDALTSALTVVGSIGKLLVDNINATIGSRASQTSVDDVPTVAEFNARTLASASYATAANQTTIIADIAAVPTAAEIDTELTAAHGAGSWQTNTLDSTAVQAAANAAIVANHLDHLLAVDYDPAAKPGVATALLNELVESDAGVSRYTANALEQAPSGSGLDAAGVRDALGMATANLDTQLGDIPTVAELNARSLASASYGTAANQVTIINAVAALGTGTGARTVVITVNDGTSPLENATVRLTEGANTYSGLTDVDGEVTFNLDDATYSVAITKAGYSFTGTTLVVNGNETATYSMTAITFSAPADPAKTTVAVTVVSGTSAAVSGRIVEFLLQSPPTGLGLVYVDTRVTAVVPANGITTAALYKGAVYKMAVVGSTPWQDLTIPAAAGDSYTDVPPLVV